MVAFSWLEVNCFSQKRLCRILDRQLQLIKILRVMDLLESCEIISLQKQPFLVVPRRLGRLSWRNAPIGEDRGYGII